MTAERALADRYHAMLAQMGVEPARHPLHFSRSDDGSAHLAPLPEGGWLRQVSERGRVTGEARFADSDALLYRLACDVAAAEGARWQAQLPPDGRDPRRADFARRLDLVGRVSPAWRIRLAEELAQWLARHPYVDRMSAPEPDPGRPQPKGWAGLLVVAVLVAGWAAAHIPLWQVWHQQAGLERTGTPARATVVERHRTDGKFADEYLLTYRYQAGGRELTGEDSVDWQTFRRTEPPGAGIDVLYDPVVPETSMVAGNDRAGRLMWIYAAIDAMLVLLILRGWWRLRQAGAAG